MNSFTGASGQIHGAMSRPYKKPRPLPAWQSCAGNRPRRHAQRNLQRRGALQTSATALVRSWSSRGHRLQGQRGLFGRFILPVQAPCPDGTVQQADPDAQSPKCAATGAPYGFPCPLQLARQFATEIQHYASPCVTFATKTFQSAVRRSGSTSWWMGAPSSTLTGDARAIQGS